MQAVATRVRAFRKQRGLTQAELAANAGLAEGTISRLEKNHEPPTLNSLARIAAALGVPIEQLLTGVPVTPQQAATPRAREQRQLAELLARLDRRAIRQLLGLARLLVTDRVSR